MGYAVFILVMLVCAGLGVWRFLRSSGQWLVFRIIDALLPFSAAALFFLTIVKISDGPNNPWNECKLAPVVAMTRGYALYQNPDDGVMTAWPYGPIGAIVLLPSALASDPSTCVIVGLAIETICYAAPLFWLMLQASDSKTKPLAWAILILIGWVTGTHEDLARCALISGPDGPVVCFGALACAALLGRRTTLMLAVSTLCAVLCCWTKQNFLPILGALVIWIAIVDGWRKALIYSGILAGVAAVVSTILILSFGAHNLYFHMITIPASHPWQHVDENGHFIVLSSGVIDLITNCSLELTALVFVLVIESALRRFGRNDNSQSASPESASPPLISPWLSNVQRWIAERPWSLPLFVAIILIPTSVFGYIKVGGFVNHLACTNYFLVIAVAMGLINVIQRTEIHLPRAPAIATGLVTLLGLTLAVQTMLTPYNVMAGQWDRIRTTYLNPQMELYAYAQAHSEQVYAPWNNLTTLYADGRLYHFEWGLLDRYYAKRMPSAKQFYEHIPPKLNMVVYITPPQSTACQNVLSNYTQRVNIDGLKDCIVFVKQEPGSPPR